MDIPVRDAEIEESTSPVPKEPIKTYSFGEALQQAIGNRRIQRLAWPEEEYGYFIGDFLHIHRDGKDHVWQISKGDCCEIDWIAF